MALESLLADTSVGAALGFTKQELLDEMRIVVVGDAGVGKTTLVRKLEDPAYKPRDDEDATFFETTHVACKVDEIYYSVALFDVGGGDDAAAFRRLVYEQADMLLVCYAVNDPESFAHATELWVPEIRSTVANAVVSLVGLKVDTRTRAGRAAAKEEQGKSSVSYVNDLEGEAAAAKLGTRLFIELSTQRDAGKAVFDKIVVAAVQSLAADRRERDGGNKTVATRLLGKKKKSNKAITPIIIADRPMHKTRDGSLLPAKYVDDLWGDCRRWMISDEAVSVAVVRAQPDGEGDETGVVGGLSSQSTTTLGSSTSSASSDSLSKEKKEKKEKKDKK